MIRIDIGGAWAAASDFLRRHSKSRAVRAAEKRREERRKHQTAEQAKRVGAVAGVSAAGTFGYALTVAPIASAAVAGGAAAVAALALMQLWRSRKRPGEGFSREELTALPGEAEEWLLDHRHLLPAAAGPSVDSVLTHLGDLPRHLARLDPNSTMAWEARRLVGDHLPTLVGAWCGLPAISRQDDIDARQRLLKGLQTIAEELGHLCRELSYDDRFTLETRERFLDSRYRDSAWRG
ncbi:MAG TPA: hypothetical protein VGB59_10050 [Allosphingosinicella sp.]|jgi:hypothetical protein